MVQDFRLAILGSIDSTSDPPPLEQSFFISFYAESLPNGEIKVAPA